MLRNALSLVALLFCTAALVAQMPKPPAKAEPKDESDPYAELVAKLHTKKVKLPNAIKDTPLRTLKEQLEKEYDVMIVVREDLFTLQGEADDDIMDRKFRQDTNLNGLPLEAFLRVALPEIKATFLVRKHYIEITTWEAASANFDDPLAEKFRQGGVPLPESIRDTPLVSIVIKDRPFDRVVADLADAYGFTVIVANQANEDAKINVSARLMNVPFPTALDVLALNAGLKVVRRDNTFIVTTVEHAGNLKAKTGKPGKK